MNSCSSCAKPHTERSDMTPLLWLHSSLREVGPFPSVSSLFLPQAFLETHPSHFHKRSHNTAQLVVSLRLPLFLSLGLLYPSPFLLVLSEVEPLLRLQVFLARRSHPPILKPPMRKAQQVLHRSIEWLIVSPSAPPRPFHTAPPTSFHISTRDIWTHPPSLYRLEWYHLLWAWPPYGAYWHRSSFFSKVSTDKPSSSMVFLFQ